MSALASSTSHPNTGTIAQTQHNDPNSCSPAKEDGSTPAIGRKGAASDNEDQDNDSVQGLEVSRAETTHECRKTTPSIPQRRLVVRLKLTIPLDDNEYDRDVNNQANQASGLRLDWLVFRGVRSLISSII